MSDRSAIIAELLPFLDQEHAEGFIDHRKAMKRPLTAFGARLIAKELAKCQNPNEAIAEAILRGWQGFKASWFENVQTGQFVQNVRKLTRAEHLQEELRQRIRDEQTEQNAARGFDLASDERLPGLFAERVGWRH